MPIQFNPTTVAIGSPIGGNPTASGILWNNAGVLASGPLTTDASGNIVVPTTKSITMSGNNAQIDFGGGSNAGLKWSNAGAIYMNSNNVVAFRNVVNNADISITASSGVFSGGVTAGGATIGSNALAVTGTIQGSSTITGGANIIAGVGGTFTTASGNVVLQPGASGNLYLADNSGTALLAFGIATNNINLPSNILFGMTSGAASASLDTILRRNAAANWQLGAAAVDTAPVAQTLSVQNTLAGGTSNVAGANFTIAGSQGKGTGVGGSVILAAAPAGSTGTAVNPLLSVAAVNPTGFSVLGGSRIGFTTSGSDPTGTVNAGFSNPSNLLISVDSGANGNFGGSMKMTNITLLGTLTVPGVAVAAITSTGTFTSGAGASLGTLTNAPAAGNPTSWIKIVDNGVTRYIPAW